MLVAIARPKHVGVAGFAAKPYAMKSGSKGPDVGPGIDLDSHHLFWRSKHGRATHGVDLLSRLL